MEKWDKHWEWLQQSESYLGVVVEVVVGVVIWGGGQILHHCGGGMLFVGAAATSTSFRPPVHLSHSAGGAPVRPGGGGGRCLADGPGAFTQEPRAGQQRGRGGAADPAARGFPEGGCRLGGEVQFPETAHHGMGTLGGG